MLLGDRGYISNQQQLDLFESVNIRLETPTISNLAATVRRNIKNRHMSSEKPEKDRSAEAIETLFSQLCDQFMIRRNYAKNFDGFRTRILAKITALTSIQYINKYVLNRTNNIKIQIT